MNTWPEQWAEQKLREIAPAIEVAYKAHDWEEYVYLKMQSNKLYRFLCVRRANAAKSN